jgi:ABC-type amino acid transport substrate-binding protein
VLVEERIADAGTGPFVQGFGELLAGAWDLSIDLPAVPFEDASIAFAAGQVDAVIAPEDAAALLEGQALPLFDDSVGTPWQLVLPRDEGFVRAVEDFLGAILLRGDYGSIYEQSFGVTPSYERLEPLISP